jgi:hypothetical protein
MNHNSLFSELFQFVVVSVLVNQIDNKMQVIWWTTMDLLVSWKLLGSMDDEQQCIILVFILCITTCIAHGSTTRIWHVAVHCPPTTFVWLLELKYISHVGFHILSIDITIFFINDTFYDIQLFHSPAGHEGASSLHRNELTPRDSNDHFTQLSDDNNTWAIWWLVWIVMWCDDMCEYFYDFCVIYYLCKSVSI